MAISIMVIGGVVAAACGCGGREKYDFVKESQKMTEKKVPVQVRPSCGATVLKPCKDVDCRTHTHHAKRRLQKQNRATIRGNMTMMSLEA